MGVDQLLEESANVRAISAPDLGWVRYSLGTHVDSEWWHSIEAIECGAIFIECSGSMSVQDKPELEARPAIGDRCLRCVALRTKRRLIEAGLAEFVRNAP